MPPFDTGDLEDQCFIDAPWGDTLWGIEGSSWDPDNPTHALDGSRFVSDGHSGFLQGREESGYWSMARFVQGDIWGGTHCGPIPWNIPDPLPTQDAHLTINIDLRRELPEDPGGLPPGGWVMFALNSWFTSDELPPGYDRTGHKPLVLDLIFYHDCNWNGCAYGHSEDDYAYHYQAWIGETPFGEWESWSVVLSAYLDAALNYDWPSGSIGYAADTLALYQAEFVVELKNAEGAAGVDNFDVRYGPPTLHVDSIALRYRDLGQSRTLVYARTQILDEDQSWVQGALVSGLWALPDGSFLDQQSVSNARGLTLFRARSRQSGVHSFCVTHVSKDGFVYDPDQNGETCDTVMVPYDCPAPIESWEACR